MALPISSPYGGNVVTPPSSPPTRAQYPTDAAYSDALAAYQQQVTAYNTVIAGGYTTDVGASTSAAGNTAAMERLRAEIASNEKIAAGTTANELGVAGIQAGAATGVASINAKAQIDALVKAGDIESARALASNLPGGTDYLNRAQQALLAGAANTSAETIANTQAGAATGVAGINAGAQTGVATIGANSAIEQLKTAAGLTQETEQQRYERAMAAQATLNTQISGYMDKFGMGGGGGGTVAPGAAVPTPTGANPDAERLAEASAFAQAKDQIGALNRATQNDIGEVSAARGINRSGLEASMRAQNIEQGRGQLGQAVRDQATRKVGRQYQVADRDVAAAQAKRAQDIGLTTSMMSLLKQTGTGSY